MDKILKRMQCNAESLKDYPTIFTDSWTALSVQKVEIVMTKTLHWTVISFSYNVSQFVELSSKKNKILTQFVCGISASLTTLTPLTNLLVCQILENTAISICGLSSLESGVEPPPTGHPRESQRSLVK